MSECITGPHIYLRKAALDDVTDRYLAWLNDPEVNKFLETRHSSQSLESIATFVRSKTEDNNEPLFAICLRADDRHIGNIKLGPISHVHRSAAISLFIGDKSCWGKGYATEAIALIMAYGFKGLKLNKLHAGAYAQNVGSIRAFERNGFQKEGLLKGQAFCDDEETDVVLLGLRVKDYQLKE